MKNLNFKIYKSLQFLAIFYVLFFIFVPVVSSAATIKNAGTSGLVGYWNFNDGVGTKTGDISGNGNTGTVSNATWTQGRFGKALYFGGVNSFVSVPNKPIFDITSSITLSAWYKKDVGSGTNKWLVHKATVNTSYSMFIEGGLKMRIEHPGMQDCATTEPSEGVWHHAVSTYDGANMRVYVDGVLKQTCAATGSINISGGGIEIGSFSSTGYPFKGVIDEVRIYNRALSASEISTLYKAGTAVLIKSAVSGKSGLVGYWPMNEGAGTQIDDASGNKNVGTLNGPSWVIGKLRNALSFDGVNDYVRTAVLPLGDLQKLSIAYWLKVPQPTGAQVITMELSSDGNANPNGAFWQLIYGNGSIFSSTLGATALYGAGPVHNSKTYPMPSVGWHHFVFVYDRSKASNQIESVYIDGVSQTLTATITSLGAGTYFRNDNLYLMSRGGISFFTGGYMDDLRIYNRVLSQSEVSDLYKSGGQSVLNASRNNVLTSGLVGLWSFDGKDMNWRTNKALDKSGQGNDGTLSNMSTTSSPTIGKIGQGLRFDGTDDYINLGTPETFNLGAGNFTLCSWFKTTNTEEDIVANGVGVNGNYLLMSYLGKLRGHIWYSSNSNTIDSNVVVNNGTWQHGCQVVDSTNISLYINGTLDKSQALVGTKAGIAGTGIIGHRSTAAGAAHFDGLIDDVRIYNRALSAGEVKQLYNAGR